MSNYAVAPHSRQRRRVAPCLTSGCNLSPALDLDVNLQPLGTYLAKTGVFSQNGPRLSIARITRTQVVRSGHQRDLLPLRIVVSLLEVGPRRLPNGAGLATPPRRPVVEQPKAFGKRCVRPILIAGLVLTPKY
jgi:hypothetical protein